MEYGVISKQSVILQMMSKAKSLLGNRAIYL